jgi:hypothetical protein
MWVKAWPTFQKRSWTVMTIIMSTTRKDKNAWGIPSMETCDRFYNNKILHLCNEMKFTEKIEKELI